MLNKAIDFVVKYPKRILYPFLAFYWLLLLTLTSIPLPEPPKILHMSDKIEHILAFSGLAFLINFTIFAQNKFYKLKKHVLISTMLVIAVYGAIDELHQPYFNRICDIYDFLADIVGGLIGTSFSLALITYYRRTKTN